MRVLGIIITAAALLFGSVPARAAFHLEYAEGAEPGRGAQIPLTAPTTPVERSVPRSAVEQWPRPGSVKERLVAAWPGDDEWMLRVVSCESGFDAGATSPSGNHHGYFQMGGWAKANYGDPRSQSVEEQAASAWALLRAEGSGQWECSPYSYHP